VFDWASWSKIKIREKLHLGLSGFSLGDVTVVPDSSSMLASRVDQGGRVSVEYAAIVPDMLDETMA
jgi:hypothetical protein